MMYTTLPINTPTIMETMKASKTEELFFLLLTASFQKIYRPMKNMIKRPISGLILRTKLIIFEIISDTDVSYT